MLPRFPPMVRRVAERFDDASPNAFRGNEMTDQWLTFRELGARLGCTPDAARMYARRRGWERRSPNKIGVAVRVLVPEHVGMSQSSPNGSPPVAEAFDDERPALVAALAVAHAQLAIANDRARRAEQLFDDEHRRFEMLWTALADAQAAERIANTDAAGLRGELDRRRAWSLPRRLVWAWRRR